MLRMFSSLRPGVQNAWKSQSGAVNDTRRAAFTRRAESHRSRTLKRRTGGSSSHVRTLPSEPELIPVVSPDFKSVIATMISQSISEVLNTAFCDSVFVQETAKLAFGDYQYSGVMQLFAQVPADEMPFKQPRELAIAISKSLEPSNMFRKVEVAGPGFINFFLAEEQISAEVTKMLRRTDAVWPSTGKKVIVDFSSPNIAKEMHVGHLRSTIIGDSLCRALEYRGFSVTRVNHVGDWGTQFGMLIAYMNDLGEVSTDELSDLQSFYKRAKIKFDSDEDFKRRSQAFVTKLQAYDEETYELWKRICQVSRLEFEEIYKDLDVKIEERGESFYNPIIPTVLEELTEKGIAVVNDGALCIFSEGSEVPLICRKSDGGFNYASTDLAALSYRTRSEDADWIIYVTDMSQQRHFDAVFDAARRAGWLNDKKRVKVNHVGFGLVIGEDGKRLRTRSGETVRLKDLLMEAKERCLQQFEDREVSLDSQMLHKSARDLGISAVKYADLRNNISTNYTFSFERMLDMKGNTAVYLQYTVARVCAILERGNAKSGRSAGLDHVHLNCSTQQERALFLQLLKFEDAVDSMIECLMPSKICEFTYTLCVLFNNFYSECRIFGDDEEDARLATCSLTLNILEKCFKIMGIQPLKKL